MKFIKQKYKVMDLKTGGIKIMVHPKVQWYIKRDRYNVNLFISDKFIENFRELLD